MTSVPLPELRHELGLNFRPAAVLLGVAQWVEQMIKFVWNLLLGELAHHDIVEELLHIHLPGRGTEAMQTRGLEERKAACLIPIFNSLCDIVDGLT